MGHLELEVKVLEIDVDEFVRKLKHLLGGKVLKSIN